MLSPVPEPARQFQLPGGEQISLRPLDRADGPRLQAYVRSLSPQARYNRFLGAVSELPQAELARMENDGSTLVAEAGVNGSSAIVAEARYALAPNGRGYEFAISVGEDWRGKGLATLLLDQIECRARNSGVPILVGDVLRTNTRMQQVARRRGFRMTRAPYEARLVRVVKDLSHSETTSSCADSLAPLSLAA